MVSGSLFGGGRVRGGEGGRCGSCGKGGGEGKEAHYLLLMHSSPQLCFGSCCSDSIQCTRSSEPAITCLLFVLVCACQE
jgi:hypothetical protein